MTKALYCPAEVGKMIFIEGITARFDCGCRTEYGYRQEEEYGQILVDEWHRSKQCINMDENRDKITASMIGLMLPKENEMTEEKEKNIDVKKVVEDHYMEPLESYTGTDRNDFFTKVNERVGRRFFNMYFYVKKLK